MPPAMYGSTAQRHAPGTAPQRPGLTPTIPARHPCCSCGRLRTACLVPPAPHRSAPATYPHLPARHPCCNGRLPARHRLHDGRLGRAGRQLAPHGRQLHAAELLVLARGLQAAGSAMPAKAMLRVMSCVFSSLLSTLQVSCTPCKAPTPGTYSSPACARHMQHHRMGGGVYRT